MCAHSALQVKLLSAESSKTVHNAVGLDLREFMHPNSPILKSRKGRFALPLPPLKQSIGDIQNCKLCGLDFMGECPKCDFDGPWEAA